MADEIQNPGGAGIPVRNPARSPLAAFREAAGTGRIAVGGGARPFPPRYADPSGELDLGTATGGVVYSATRVARRGDPYTLALVDLPGGGRVLGLLLADEPAALVGRPVRLVQDGQPFPTFAPEQPA